MQFTTNYQGTFSRNHASSPRGIGGTTTLKEEVEVKQSNFKPCSNEV